MSHCPRCDTDLPLEAFYPDTSKRDGVSSWCRACTLAHRKSDYAADRDKYQARNRAYYRSNRERFVGYNRKVRAQVLEAYGGRCMCCGEDTPEFLGIDHVNNDGESHRRELKGYGRSIYQWLKREGYPQDGRFQLLCHNCNMAKGCYGACPHQGKPPGHRIGTREWAA